MQEFLLNAMPPFRGPNSRQRRDLRVPVPATWTKYIERPERKFEFIYVPPHHELLVEQADRDIEVIQRAVSENTQIDQVRAELNEIDRRQIVLIQSYNIWASENPRFTPEEHVRHFAEFKRKMENPEEELREYDSQRSMVELGRLLYAYRDLPLFDSVVFIGENDLFRPIPIDKQQILQDRVQVTRGNHPLIIVDSRHDRTVYNRSDNFASRTLRRLTKPSPPPEREQEINLRGIDLFIRSIDNIRLNRLLDNVKLNCRSLIVADDLAFPLQADAEYIGLLATVDFEKRLHMRGLNKPLLPAYPPSVRLFYSEGLYNTGATIKDNVTVELHPTKKIEQELFPKDKGDQPRI